MRLYDEFLRLLARLEQDQIEYAVCGGIAVVIHGFTRATKDIDLLIEPGSIVEAKAAVKRAGFPFEALPMNFPARDGSVTEVHRVSRVEGEDILTVDLIVAGPGLEGVFRDRQTFDWNGRKLQVVSRDGLATMKRRAGRGQDLVDLQRLGIDESKD